jgi:hypothetical protein
VFGKFTIHYSIYFTLYISFKKRENFTLRLSESCCDLRSRLLTLYFVSHPWHHIIKTSHSCSHNRTLALVIVLSHSHLLAFCSSLSHIAYLIKFNYYLNPLIIGRVTHPLTPLSSTSSSVIILIIIDTVSVSMAKTSPLSFLEFLAVLCAKTIAQMVL